MPGNYYTFPELLIWIPFATGLIILFIKKDSVIKRTALFSSLIILIISVISLFYADPSSSLKNYYYYNVGYYWMPYLGASFSVGMDGLGMILTFLTAFSFPLVFLNLHFEKTSRPSVFYSLLLFLEAALTGVFVSCDVLLFFMFWLLVFVLIYFLNSGWERSKEVYLNFRTFAIMLAGSFLMLTGILILYQLTSQQDAFSVHSFSLKAFYSLSLNVREQLNIFGLFFLAFALTIPLFPFHTWFSGSSDNTSFPMAMLTGGVVTKMGAYLLLKWIIPLFPLAIARFQPWLIGLSLAGYIYAAAITYFQISLKKAAVWICISTMGFVAAGIFLTKDSALRGGIAELFTQGINILGLFIVFWIIKDKTGSSKLTELKGLFRRSPLLTVYLLIVLLGILGAPLTDTFRSKRMILSEFRNYNNWFSYLAYLGIGVTFAYVWRFGRIVFSINKNEQNGVFPVIQLRTAEVIALTAIVLIIIAVGVYPDLLLHFARLPVKTLIGRMGENVSLV